MKEIALDNSTAVFLAKLGLFPLLLKQGVRFITTPEIEKEVEAGVAQGYRDAVIRKQLMEENKIKVVAAKDAEKVQRAWGLGTADASIIALAMEGDCVLATEDAALQNLAKAHGIELTIAAALVEYLYTTKGIPNDQALLLCNLLEIHRYSKSIVIKVRERIMRGGNDG